jgi:hypothetical protein
MDDFVKLVIILSFLLIGGIQVYCNKYTCDTKTTQLSIISFYAILYVLNIYLLIKGFANYKKDDLWKIVGVLLLVPFIAYTRMCEDKCYDMFIPVLFVIIPCIMIILNVYFLLSNPEKNKNQR